MLILVSMRPFGGDPGVESSIPIFDFRLTGFCSSLFKEYK
jgi:hypothetical protein